MQMEDAMAAATKARAVGFNHVAIEVGDIDAALAFYGRFFEFHLRSKNDSMAFIDLGDQFLALQKGRTQPAALIRSPSQSNAVQCRDTQDSAATFLYTARALSV